MQLKLTNVSLKDVCITKKIWRRFVLSFSRKTHTLIPKNDVTELKTRLLK